MAAPVRANPIIPIRRFRLVHLKLAMSALMRRPGLRIKTQIVKHGLNLRRSHAAWFDGNAGTARVERHGNMAHAVKLAERTLDAGSAAAAGHALNIKVEGLHR